MSEQLPSGWVRPNRDLHWYSDVIELVVRRAFAGDTYTAYMRTTDIWEIGTYPTQDEAIKAAEEYARKELQQVLRNLDRS